MSIPGFIGEASLYDSLGQYYTIGAGSAPGFAAEASHDLTSAQYGLTGAVRPALLPCGSPNWVCCSPPGWVTNPDNIVSCDAGWGCDVASGGWCTQPCGN